MLITKKVLNILFIWLYDVFGDDINEETLIFGLVIFSHGSGIKCSIAAARYLQFTIWWEDDTRLNRPKVEQTQCPAIGQLVIMPPEQRAVF